MRVRSDGGVSELSTEVLRDRLAWYGLSGVAADGFTAGWGRACDGGPRAKVDRRTVYGRNWTEGYDAAKAWLKLESAYQARRAAKCAR